MNWDDVKKLISNVAPTLFTGLGTLVAGPAGTVVGGLAGKVLTQVFGTSSPDKLTEVISQDPQAAVKLREAELTFQLEMAKIELDETKSFLADVQNARAREIAMKGSNATFYSIGWIITCSFFGAIVLLTFKPVSIDAQMRDVLNMMLGYLASNFTTVVQYFFGSSKGSADKASLIDRILKK